MNSLRQLSAVYLLAASAFGVSIVLAQNPDWAAIANAVAGNLRQGTGEMAVRLNESASAAATALNETAIKPGYAIAREGADVLSRTIAQWTAPAPERAVTPKPVAPLIRPPPVSQLAAAKPQAQKPQAAAPVPETPAPPQRVARAPLELAPLAETPPPQAPPNLPALSQAELVRVQQRLKDSLTSEMFANFDLFLYVSKAGAGPWAQHMYVFQKTGDGFTLLYNWPVSTGRERIEDNGTGKVLFSNTPAGYYELDPNRFHAHYRSVQWNHPMPHAMFLDWMKNGYETGIAIHGVLGDDIAHLGTRASAGCVRLAPENAALLFDLIRANYKGLVPKFAYDKKTATISNDGVMVHDTDGRLELAEGYKVLLFIEDYGGENVVAALF